MKHLILHGARVMVRALKEQDMSEYLLRLSSTVQELLHISSPDAEQQYIEERLKQEGDNCMYAIVENSSGLLIGGLEIRPVPPFFGQLYVWINDQFWGYGYFQEAITLVASAYFEHTDASSFTAHVDVSNKRSYGALKKCGFIDIGMCNGAYGKQYILIYRRKVI